MNPNDNSTPLIEDYLQLKPDTLPDTARILCKFVILRYHDRIHFIYGPVTEYPYHANLLEQFCKDRNIPCSWASRPTMLELFSPDTIIRGGGYAEIKTGLKLIQFGGRSTAYGRYSRADLEEILSHHKLIDGYVAAVNRD